MYRFIIILLLLLITSCTPAASPSSSVQVPEVQTLDSQISSGFVAADASRVLSFPQDFGAHEDFHTEWWYYTGNLATPEGRPFGFELTIFRVGLLPPTAELPSTSKWYGHSIYFAHFALSDIEAGEFHAFERYSRPGPGLAGAQSDPYRVWLEDWNITQQSPGVYQLQAQQGEIRLDLTLNDEMGVVLHGENGYSRKGKGPGNASYYYSQPRLRSEGTVQLNGRNYPVKGLTWMDHEFSTSVLDSDQVGWDWFSLQFESGPVLMLFQLRERDGRLSDASSGTFVDEQGKAKPLLLSDFKVHVKEEWRSPHTQAVYPAAWEVQINQPNCLLQASPLMSDQEVHFPAVTYWEGAVQFDGTCDGKQVRGKGYIELTGYGGKLPLP